MCWDSPCSAPACPPAPRGRPSTSSAAPASATASAFGAGFGGSVWALIPTADADGFAAEWMDRYRRTDGAPETASALVTRPGAAGRRIAPVPA